MCVNYTIYLRKQQKKAAQNSAKAANKKVYNSATVISIIACAFKAI